MKKTSISTLIEEQSNFMYDSCTQLAELLADEDNLKTQIEDVIEDVVSNDYLSIIYYTDAIDFIKEYWEYVDEEIRHATTLFEAVRLAQCEVINDEMHEHLTDAVKLAGLYYIKQKGMTSVDINAWKEIEAFIEDEIDDMGTFADVAEFIDEALF